MLGLRTSQGNYLVVASCQLPVESFFSKNWNPNLQKIWIPIFIYIYIYACMLYIYICMYVYIVYLYQILLISAILTGWSRSWLFGSSFCSFSASFQAARWSWRWEKIGEIHGKIMGKIMGKYRKIMGKSDSSDHEMADVHGKIPWYWQFCFSTEG